MWTAVYNATSKDIALKILTCLQGEGVLVKLNPTSGNNYEVLVPESEVEEAQSIIAEQNL